MYMRMVGVAVKTKLPLLVEYKDVDETTEIVITDVELKTTLWPVVVMELPLQLSRLVPEMAPKTVKPAPAPVIVEETKLMLTVCSVDRKTTLSEAVAVKSVDDSSVTPMLVAEEENRMLFSPVAVNCEAEALIATTFAELSNSALW
jgi:hypothetical protein